MSVRAVRLISLAVLTTLAASTALSAPVGPACDAGSLLRSAGRLYGANGLKSLAIEAHGFDFAIGQSYLPGGPWPRFRVESYRRQIDLAAQASNLVQVREQGEQPPRGGARQPLAREEQHIAVAAGSTKEPALTRELAALLPVSALRLIGTMVAPVAQRGAEGLCTIVAPLPGGAPLAIGFASDGEMRAIRTVVPHDLLGEVAQVTRFEGALTRDGFRFPARIVQNVGGHPVLDLAIDRVIRNPEVAVAADVTPPKQAWMAADSMPSRKLAEGIFLVPGRYSSVAVDNGTDVTLIEANQSAQRAREIVAEVARLIPGKPIGRVIYTHAHFDHLGGLHAIAGQVPTIIVHRENVVFVRSLLQRGSATRMPTVEGVGETAVLGKGDQAVRLYHLPSDHARGMLIAYLPATKTLIVADAFIPTATPTTPLPKTPNPYTVQLLTAVERLKLDVREIIPIHYAADGRQVGMADLRRQAGR